jgi:serine/threonine protein kinase
MEDLFPRPLSDDAGSFNAQPGILREGQQEEFDGFIAAGGYGEVYRVRATFAFHTLSDDLDSQRKDQHFFGEGAKNLVFMLTKE